MKFRILEVENGRVLVDAETGEFRGTGNFCGWYTQEFMENVRVLGGYKLPEKTYECDHQKTMQIKTIMTNIEFDADTIEAARKKLEDCRVCDLNLLALNEEEKRKKSEQDVEEFQRLWNWLASHRDDVKDGAFQLSRLQYLLKEYYTNFRHTGGRR